jgi:predicted house-cleaning noncanonical NTP pyrophosphatase (MazG superfamily)
MGDGVYNSWELGLEDPPIPEDVEYAEEVISKLLEAVEEYLTFSTTRDLIKLIALHL